MPGLPFVRGASGRPLAITLVLLELPLGWGSSTNAATTSGASSGSASGSIVAEPPSCAPHGPGMTDCGPNKESCCTSLLVNGGTFYRTYSSDADGGPTLVADP